MNEPVWRVLNYLLVKPLIRFRLFGECDMVTILRQLEPREVATVTTHFCEYCSEYLEEPRPIDLICDDCRKRWGKK